MNPVSGENNFLYLVISLVALLLVGALVDQFPSNLGQYFFQAITVITLASSIVDLRSTRLMFHTGIGFTVSVLVVVVLGIVLNVSGMSYLHLLILTLFSHG